MLKNVIIMILFIYYEAKFPSLGKVLNKQNILKHMTEKDIEELSKLVYF